MSLADIAGTSAGGAAQQQLERQGLGVDRPHHDGRRPGSNTSSRQQQHLEDGQASRTASVMARGEQAACSSCCIAKSQGRRAHRRLGDLEHERAEKGGRTAAEK
eukprot:3426506-Rhodomonas_salina.1